jgi:hypothetical protein
VVDFATREETPQVPQVQLDERLADLLAVLREDCQEELVFEKLRDAINAAIDAAGSTDPPDVLAQMRRAVVEARSSIEAMRQGVAETEAKLQYQRGQLADAERRGRLAHGIQDQETADVAERFAAKHRERVEVLEQKLDAQRDELTLAEREYEEMKTQFVEAERSRPASDAARSVESAWRDLEAAGGKRPETDLEGDLLRRQMERSAREARAQEQLEELKRKMGKG